MKHVQHQFVAGDVAEVAEASLGVIKAAPDLSVSFAAEQAHFDAVAKQPHQEMDAFQLNLFQPADFHRDVLPLVVGIDGATAGERHAAGVVLVVVSERFGGFAAVNAPGVKQVDADAVVAALPLTKIAVGEGDDAENEGASRRFLTGRVVGVFIGKRLNALEIYVLAHDSFQGLASLPFPHEGKESSDDEVIGGSNDQADDGREAVVAFANGYIAIQHGLRVAQPQRGDKQQVANRKRGEPQRGSWQSPAVKQANEEGREQGEDKRQLVGE